MHSGERLQLCLWRLALERIRSKRQAAFFERYVEALVAEAGKLGMGKAQVLALVEKGFDHE